LNFGSVRTAPALALTPEAVFPPGGISQLKTGEEAAVGKPLAIDWTSLGLGLVALVAVLGLIPFWMWIYFVYNPPIR